MNCIDCAAHRVIPDPDPDDSFNRDDVAVVCTLQTNNRKNASSPMVSERQDFRIVTCACRPYNTRKESDAPNWCPKGNGQIETEAETNTATDDGSGRVSTFENCTLCPNHQVIPDPDPDDSFNRDDVAVVCKLSDNPKIDRTSKFAADRQNLRIVTCACRPYNTEKESQTPDWCPLPALKAHEEAEHFKTRIPHSVPQSKDNVSI